MMLNHYDRERFAQAHHRDLLREAEHERLLAQLSEPSQPRHRMLQLPAQFKLSWRALRIRLQHGFQRRSA